MKYLKMTMINLKRVRILKQGKTQPGPVVYWMSRDQRAEDNWALLYAQQIAVEQKRPLVVLFCLVPDFLNASLRQYGFMLRGLAEVQERLAEKKIPLSLVAGEPAKEVSRFLNEHRAAAVVTDFDPLRIKRQWKAAVLKAINISCYEVDAHNIVPCWEASGKQEYGAYTIRPKIQRLLAEYMTEYPLLKKHPFGESCGIKKLIPARLLDQMPIRKDVGEIPWCIPGEKAAHNVLRIFIQKKLKNYKDLTRDPCRDGQSHLSPYLHFGQISAQRVALKVMVSDAPAPAKDAFLEELIIRRELSDNFCFYNPDYHRVSSFPVWAKKTLDLHGKDRREYCYSLKEFELAQTHDPLWNAAQIEMVTQGKMHGFMRMYWAKKILEWSETPARAMKTAIFLNDKYELDGRDPNGYAGIAWSIGGVHDRPWGERPVFGMVRYMSYNGCISKFDVDRYTRAFLKVKGA